MVVISKCILVSITSALSTRIYYIIIANNKLFYRHPQLHTFWICIVLFVSEPAGYMHAADNSRDNSYQNEVTPPASISNTTVCQSFLFSLLSGGIIPRTLFAIFIEGATLRTTVCHNISGQLWRNAANWMHQPSHNWDNAWWDTYKYRIKFRPTP